jgi:hypothetical protein
MTDRFSFITYKMYVLQGTRLFLLFNNKNKHEKKERVREEEEEV